MSLDTVLDKIESSSSQLNLYRNFNRDDRIRLNSTSCINSSDNSCNKLYRSLNPAEFQAFDYGRYTKYDTAARQDCVRWCGLNFSGSPEKYQQCIKDCAVETRYDYV